MDLALNVLFKMNSELISSYYQHLYWHRMAQMPCLKLLTPMVSLPIQSVVRQPKVVSVDWQLLVSCRDWAWMSVEH